MTDYLIFFFGILTIWYFDNAISFPKPQDMGAWCQYLELQLKRENADEVQYFEAVRIGGIVL